MANIVDGAVLDRELNPEQAAAAKKIDGPMLILAGAGSGKTRCITYKIAHLVSQHGVEADRILAVTFTNKAAREMKSRIQKLLDCNMNFSWMGTFHSVCLRLLKLCLSKESVVAAMGGQWYDGNFSIYDDDDQKRILITLLPMGHVPSRILLTMTRHELRNSSKPLAASHRRMKPLFPCRSSYYTEKQHNIIWQQIKRHHLQRKCGRWPLPSLGKASASQTISHNLPTFYF